MVGVETHVGMSRTLQNMVPGTPSQLTYHRLIWYKKRPATKDTATLTNPCVVTISASHRPTPLSALSQALCGVQYEFHEVGSQPRRATLSHRSIEAQILISHGLFSLIHNQSPSTWMSPMKVIIPSMTDIVVTLYVREKIQGTRLANLVVLPGCSDIPCMQRKPFKMFHPVRFLWRIPFLLSTHVAPSSAQTKSCTA